MADVLQAESAYLRATARYKTWLEKFVNHWTQPYQDMMFIAWWEAIPEPFKKELEKANPEAFEQVQEQYELIKQGG